MSLPAALDVLIGMALIFAVMAAATSAIREAFASLLAARAANLRKRMIAALGDPGSWARIEDTLVGLGMVRRRGVLDRLGGGIGGLTYVDRSIFTDTLKRWGAGVANGTLPGNSVPEPVARLLRDAGNDIARFNASIDTWVDNVLAESSRRFAQRTHLWLFVIGFGLAANFDVSAIRLADYLWHNEAARTALVAEAERRAASPAAAGGNRTPQQIAEDLRADLGGTLALPVRAWIMDPALPPLMSRATVSKPPTERGPPATIYGLSLLGWLITAAASVLGAKYWFDTIQTLMRFKPNSA
jgi:hypothetical protein